MKATNVRHGLKAVVVVAKYYALEDWDQEWYLDVNLRTTDSDATSRRFYSEVWVPSFGRPRASLYEADTLTNGPITCDGMRKKVDYAANAVWIRIPRSCLAKPQTVQFQAYSVLHNGPDNQNDDGGSTNERPGLNDFSAPLFRGPATS
jgi:hypothetical protein